MHKSRLLHCIREGVASLHVACTLAKKDSDPPPPPDFAGAARAEAQASKENLAAQTWANRPTQRTPWGATTWGAEQKIDPATGQPVTAWTQDTTLDPRLQGALNSQIAVQGGRSRLGEGMLRQIGDTYSTPMDWGGLPAAPGDTADAAQQAAFSRMQALQRPDIEYDRQQAEQSRANRGITGGSPQQEREMRLQGDIESRATLNNLLAAGAEGRAMGGYQQGLRTSAIGERLQRRQLPLNELNALLTGQQVTPPQFGDVARASSAQAPNLLDAMGRGYNANLNSYNARQAGQQGLMSGLGDIAQLALMFA